MDNWNKGFIRFVVLLMMNREPVYGNKIAKDIQENTNGAWKPSFGSIYPALQSLVKEGLAEKYTEEGRVMYKITEDGKAFLKKASQNHRSNSGIRRFFGKMWMDALNPADKGEFLLNSVRNTFSSIDLFIGEYENSIENDKAFDLFLRSLEVELETGLEKARGARERLGLKRVMKVKRKGSDFK